MTLVSKAIRQSAKGNHCASCYADDDTVTWRHAPSISKLLPTRGLKPTGCKGSQKSNDTWGAPLCYRCDAKLQEGDWSTHFATKEAYYAEWFRLIDNAQNGPEGLIANELLRAP